MMKEIRREGDDGKTWLLAYGDSISDGFGSTDPLKVGYINLLKEGLKKVDPTFDVVQNSAGFRCVSKTCFRPCFKDAYCQEAQKLNVSAVTMFIGTNDCKGAEWNLENFKRDYVDLCKSFRNMESKPDVFAIIPPPVYKDGFGKVNITVTNTILPELIRPLSKECGLTDGQVINLHDAMGGSSLSAPYFYCDGRHCDGYHPTDPGQVQMAQTILKSVVDFYMKNPKGQKQAEEREHSEAKKEDAPKKPSKKKQSTAQTEQKSSKNLMSADDYVL